MMLKSCRWPQQSGWWVLVPTALILLLLSACDGQRVGSPVVPVAGGDPVRGRELLTPYGCAGCHTIPGVRGAEATVGPPLTDWADRWYIAGLLSNEPDELVRWIQDPQSIKPGVAMPDTGVSPEDAWDIAAYLYTLSRGR
jgi:cytochrome c2